MIRCNMGRRGLAGQPPAIYVLCRKRLRGRFLAGLALDCLSGDSERRPGRTRQPGPDFKDTKRITDVNSQQAEYLWGRRILFDFNNKDVLRLQGILALPGEKRPMRVNFYEKNSQNLHRYTAPSCLSSMGSSPIQAVSEAYVTMLPDIHFRTGASHSDMLECVEAATRKVIERHGKSQRLDDPLFPVLRSLSQR